MLSQIHQQLEGHPWQDRIHWFETLDSTNNCAKELARNGAAEGTVVIADAQTGGSTTVVISVHDITSDKEKLSRLVEDCNKLELSSVHLYDVVEDFLAE